MARYLHRHVERVMSLGSACALVGGIAAFDDRVRLLVTGAVSSISFETLIASLGQSRQIVFTTYTSISQNPLYGPVTLFAVVAGTFTLLMWRS